MVVATLEAGPDTDVARALESQSFTDYEVLFRDDYPVTKARNEGIREAAADKIVFLDDDSRPRPGYLRRAAEVLDWEAAYAGRTVHPRDDIFAEHFTGHYDWGETPCYVDKFWGCNMGVRAEVFETVGGWDERMGWGHEEKELANRVVEEYDILYDPSLVVEHPYVSSIADYWRKQYRLETQTPYLWDKQGYSTTEQLRRILAEAVRPRKYVRRGPLATLTQTGANVAKTAGRLRGLARDDTVLPSESVPLPADPPRLSPNDSHTDE